jgi:hypothetical protein
MVDAAALIQKAAKDLKQDDSFWASVGVNVFSNRLDAWLFGGGADKQGLLALLAALASLAVALIKVLLAWNLPNSISRSRRAAEVSLSLALLLSALLTVGAVYKARSSMAAAAAPTEALVADLSSCRQNLNSALANAAVGSTPSAMWSTEVLGQVEKVCGAARAETSAGLDRIAARVEDVQSSQMGWPLKLLIFLASFGTLFLVWRAIPKL